MSPLLVSLALLALCWQPSVSWKVESNNYQNMGSYIVKENPEVGKAIASQAKSGDEVTMEKVIALLNLLPNTLLGTALAQTGAIHKMKFLEKPFDYGAICELFDPKLPEKVNAILGTPTAVYMQQMKQEMKMDCTRNPPLLLDSFPILSPASLRKVHTCLCVEDKGFYCSFFVAKLIIIHAYEQQNKPVPTVTCLSETFPALLKAGSGALGATWKDLDKFGPETVNYAVSENAEAFSTADMANILCDAVNPDVENALKAVYASNGAFWFAELFMFATAFPQEPTESDKSLSEHCNDAAFGENPYGKCICKQDTGFIFCIYKVIAESFIDEGILTCDKADKTKHTFVAGRKPRAIPSMAQAKAPTGGAATSSLTIATLAAAALLLINY